MPNVSSEEVIRLAALARIELAPEEAERLSADLGSILGYVARLEAAEPAPMTHAAPERDVFRPDAESARIGDRARDAFPESPDGFLAVPRVF